MPKKIKMYGCSYCNNFKQSKIESVLKHESRCFRNPKNKACLTCKNLVRKFLTKEEKENYVGYLTICSKLKIKHYTVKLYGNEHNLIMKKQINIDVKTDEIIGTYSKTVLFEEIENILVFPKSGCEKHQKKL